MVTTEEHAARAWRKVFDFFAATRRQRDQALGRFGITPNEARALSSLDGEGKTMGSLAELWVTDAPNATWVINRLERRKLVVRKSVPHDRRVKLVALTAKGAQLKSKLTQAIYAPPPALAE